MTEKLITPDNLSNELLKSIFDEAFMETSYTEDGALVVKEEVKCLVLPQRRSRDLVSLRVNFRLKPEASAMQQLEAVNLINEEYVIAGACVTETHLRFKWDIPIMGGITKKALVLAVKRFCTIPREATLDHARDVVS